MRWPFDAERAREAARIRSLRALETLRAYVVGQARLGYAEFDPGPAASDVILCAFPKSGSTWTSYLLHQLRSGGDESFDDIKNEVIDITPGHWDPEVNPFAIPQRHSPRTFKTHGSHARCPKGARYLYIARDPKDTLWSLYHFVHDLFGIVEKIPIEVFYRDYFVERFGTGHDIGNPWDHFLGWHPQRADPNLLWLHYEDLLEDRLRCIRSIGQFMGIELTDDLLRTVLERSTMQHTRAIAKQLNPSPTNRVGRIVARFGPETASYATSMKFGKMRRGVRGDGQRSLPQRLLDELGREWARRITPVLGYESYEQMREDCSHLSRK
jgi:hypothetical protein